MGRLPTTEVKVDRHARRVVNARSLRQAPAKSPLLAGCTTKQPACEWAMNEDTARLPEAIHPGDPCNNVLSSATPCVLTEGGEQQQVKISATDYPAGAPCSPV